MTKMLGILCIVLGLWSLNSAPVVAQEHGRPEVATVTRISRLVMGMRYMEETNLELTPEQSEKLLPLLSEFVDYELAIRARILPDNTLAVLARYVRDPENSPIVTEENRRNMDWDEEPEEGLGDMSSSGEQRAGSRDGASQGQGEAIAQAQNQSGQNKDGNTEFASQLLEQIEELVTRDQLRYLDGLPLPEISLRSAREQGSEVLILFAELVEWYLDEKVTQE